MFDETTIAWAAGFFDGEGNIKIANKPAKTGYFQSSLVISAYQVDLRPLLLLRELFRGNIYKQSPRGGNSAISYGWYASTGASGVALHAMLPYLIVKKEQAEIALSFYAMIHKDIGQKKPRLTELEKQERLELQRLLRLLTKTGQPKGNISLPTRKPSPQLRLLEGTNGR